MMSLMFRTGPPLEKAAHNHRKGQGQADDRIIPPGEKELFHLRPAFASPVAASLHGDGKFISPPEG